MTEYSLKDQETPTKYKTNNTIAIGDVFESTISVIEIYWDLFIGICLFGSGYDFIIHYLCFMEQWLNLLEETRNHFNEGARSVKAYTNDKVYIITRADDSDNFYVTLEAPGFPKTKTTSLEQYFKDVFGIEAKY